MERVQEIVRRTGFLPGTPGLRGLGNADCGRLVREVARVLTRGAASDVASAAGVEKALRAGGIGFEALRTAFEAMQQGGAGPVACQQAVRRLLLQLQADDRLTRLEAFVARTGHPFAVSEICADALLSSFVERALRGDRLMRELSPAARARFDQLGLLPSPLSLQMLKGFVRLALAVREWTGRWGLAPGSTRGPNHSIAVRVSRLRRRWREGRLDPRLVAVLGSMSFPFEPLGKERRQALARQQMAACQRRWAQAMEAGWKKTFARVRKKAEAQGHYRFSHGKRDAVWLRQQLWLYQAGKLSEARVQMLQEAGFPLAPRARGRPRRDAPAWGVVRVNETGANAGAAANSADRTGDSAGASGSVPAP